MADIKKLLEAFEERIKPLSIEEFDRLADEFKNRETAKLVNSEKYKRATDEEKFNLLIEAYSKGTNRVSRYIERRRAGLPEVYKENPEMAKLTQKIFVSGRRLPKHYLGDTEDSYLWQIKHGVAKYPKAYQQYLQSRREAEILFPDSPKFETQLKNLWAIGLLLQKVNEPRLWRGEPPVFEIEFSLAEYARVRGYADKEIKRSGKFFEELKKDLITGAKTTYTLKDVIIDGKKYTIYGVPNFYMLAEPAEKKGKWKIRINEFYKDKFLPGGQFYGIPAEVIADREIGNDICNFIEIIKRFEGNWEGVEGVFSLSVSTVIESITDSQEAISRPSEAYKLLAKCLTYAYNKDLLEAVRFFTPNLKRSKAVEDLSLFELWGYEDFKAEVLRPLKLDDIRESRIKFYSDRQRMEPAEVIEIKPEEIASEELALTPSSEAGKLGK